MVGPVKGCIWWNLRRDAYGGIGEGMHMVESVKLQSGMILQHHMTLSCGVLDLTFAVGSEKEKKNTKLTL